MYWFKTLLFAFALLCGPVSMAALESAPTRPAVMILQSSAGVTVKVGALGFSDSGFGILEQDQTVPFQGAMPELTVAAGATRSMIDAAAANWVANNHAGLTARLTGFLSRYGLSSAWYTYKKTFNSVPSAGGAVSLQLTWSLFQDAHGRASFGAPRLEPLGAASARILHVSYAEKRVYPGLPSSYGNADGGSLRWQVLDHNFSAMSGPGTSGTVNVNGAFDLSSDDQRDLRCLVDVGCGGAVNVRSLMQQVGADLALINYTYMPEPKFTSIGGGSFEALGTYAFTDRRLRYSECGTRVEYLSSGHYRYDLDIVTDSFVVDAQAFTLNSIQRYATTRAGDPIEFGGNWHTLTAQDVVKFGVPSNPWVYDPHEDGVLINASAVQGTVETLVPMAPPAGEQTCPDLAVALNVSSIALDSAGLLSAQATGGLPPYTYAWSAVDNYGGSISFTNDAAASTYALRTGPRPSGAASLMPVGHVTITVRDRQANTAMKSATVLAVPAEPEVPGSFRLVAGFGEMLYCMLAHLTAQCHSVDTIGYSRAPLPTEVEHLVSPVDPREMGSLSPLYLPDGKEVVELSYNQNYLGVTIFPFDSDPGPSYLTSLTMYNCDNATQPLTDAPTYRKYDERRNAVHYTFFWVDRAEDYAGCVMHEGGTYGVDIQ
jgi:hypothetical protein